jgi:peptidoglycan/LPS O-acetylase OafA/YrhL
MNGVSIFFVLSGFLIGKILIKTLDDTNLHIGSLWSFWIRRWFRTLPMYMLILLSLYTLTYWKYNYITEDLPLYFVFLQNFNYPHPPFFAEAWSLCVEEWFYLMTPPLLYLLIKSKALNTRSAIPIFAIFCIISIYAFRVYRASRFNYVTPEDFEINLRKQVTTRLDSLMFGVLGAYASRYLPKIWNSSPKPTFLLGAFILIVDKVLSYTIDFIFYMKYLSLTLTELGTLLMLPYLSTFSIKKHNNFTKTVTFVSVISYSMYLTHLNITQTFIVPYLMDSIHYITPKSQRYFYEIQYAIYWCTTMALSYLTCRYYELPITALRDKIKPFTTIRKTNQSRA